MAVTDYAASSFTAHEGKTVAPVLTRVLHRGRLCSLLLILVLGSLLARADVPAVHTVPSADELIRSANSMAARRDYDGAIAALRRAAERFPTDHRIYLELGTWQEQRLLTSLPGADTTPIAEQRTALRAGLNTPALQQGVSELLDTYGRGILYADDIVELKHRAADLTAVEAPIVLSEYGPLALPGYPDSFAYALADPALPGGRSVGKGLITTRPLAVGPRFLHDPKYGANPKFADDPLYGGWTFQHGLWAYDYNNNDRTWQLRFRVFWQDAPGQEAKRTELAQQAARLLLRVAGLTRAYTGLTSRFSSDGAVNIWLAEKGEIGAETYLENIYLHQVGNDRAPEEWVREFLHEYGHETLKPVTGYTDPEPDANGRLGERLFLRWLLDNPDTRADKLPWLAAMDAIEQREMRVDRLMRRFAVLGPESPLLQGTDLTALDGFVGLVLYLDCTRGSSLITTTLTRMTSPLYWGPSGFMETLLLQERAAQMNDHPIVTLDMRHLPADLPLWVYLSGGTWSGNFSRADQGVVTLSVTVDGTACTVEPTGVFTTPVIGPGWHRVVVNVENGTPAFTALSLSR
jgi:hypothetical protein